MMIEHHHPNNRPISPLTPGTQTSGNSSTYSEETFDNDSTHATAASSPVGRSHRYKVAMTARARQRRMRRMKDKNSKDTGTDNEDGDAPLTLSTITTATPSRSGGKDVFAVTPHSKNKHGVSTPTHPPASASSASSTALKNRYDRSLSASRRRSSSKSKEVTGSPSVVSPMASMNNPEGTARASPKRNNVPRTPDYGHSIHTPSNRFAPSQPPKPEPVSPSTPPSSSKKVHSFYAPQSPSKMSAPSSPTSNIANSFLPTFNNEGLSAQEVRDAHNFTSIQFQCSNLSGEVEMFSGDEFNTPGNDSQDSDLTGNEAAKSFFQNEVWSEATTPSVMQRGEIFHHKAAASIVSLLTPERMFRAGLMAPEGNSGQQEEEDCPDVNGDSPTGVVNSPGGLTFDRDDPSMSRGVEWNGVEPVFSSGAVEEEAVVRKALTTRMIAPSQQLADLLSQIHRDAKTTTVINRAFATRRKNACGALKILSAKEENRLKICWTTGVLNAISSVLADVKTKTVDEMSSNANSEARNRIVSTLLNLSVNKKNRMLICNTEGVLEAITKTIVNDDGESRQGCCTVLLYLAKTSETRPLIIRCPGLLAALSKVIEVPRPAVSQSIQLARVPSIAGIPRKMYQNRFLKAFERPKCPEENVMSEKSGSFVSPGTMSPDGTMYSPEETVSDTEDDSSSVSSATSSSGSASKSAESGSHDDPESSSSSETEESGEHSDEDSETEVEDEAPKVQANPSFVIQEMPKEMEICFKTPVSREDEEEKENEVDYDADENRFLHGSRLSIFACLLCLVKNKENAFDIARAEALVAALIGVSKKHKSPSHARAIAILAHLTRHPKNCHQLVFKFLKLLPMLQNATGSDDAEARRYALCSIQNLSMDKACRAPIAHTPKMIASLTERCNSESKEEVLAAVASLQNLSDEPANLIQFTIVKNCIGTIISIARSDKARRMDGIETDLTQFMAKNTLATISFWFRKIATSGLQRMNGDGSNSPGAVIPLYDAVLQPTEYEQWV